MCTGKVVVLIIEFGPSERVRVAFLFDRQRKVISHEDSGVKLFREVYFLPIRAQDRRELSDTKFSVDSCVGFWSSLRDRIYYNSH